MTTTCIGVMSGTSLDGLDIAYCSFTEERGRWHFRIDAAACVPYNDEWHERLARAHMLSGNGLAALHADYGRFIAEQVNLFLKDSGQPRPVLIASHGHTVFHDPERGFTQQIGSGAHIASGTGITTVNDFRAMDVALGGQGAPLVPVGDRLLFGGFAACLNLGGFSNISFEQQGERMAFDICPVNIIMNPLAERLGHRFDRDGNLAASGSILPALLDSLNRLDVYHSVSRPSLSREWVERQVLPLLSPEDAAEDVLRTVCEHAAFQMASVLDSVGSEDVLVTGGGAYNLFLIERLRTLTTMHIVVPDSTLVEYKEALVFALLGVLRMRGEVNVLRSVTGAQTDSCSGQVWTVSTCR